MFGRGEAILYEKDRVQDCEQALSSNIQIGIETYLDLLYTFKHSKTLRYYNNYKTFIVKELKFLTIYSS